MGCHIVCWESERLGLMGGRVGGGLTVGGWCSIGLLDGLLRLMRRMLWEFGSLNIGPNILGTLR